VSESHRIRLQGAWEVAAGGAAWTRSFGRPTGVGPGGRVWLVLERPAACAAALNGRPLPPVAGGIAAWRHDVTADLRDRNELRLEVHEPPWPVAGVGRTPLPEAVGLVALEIEPGD
jgi:hypothetical protein